KVGARAEWPMERVTLTDGKSYQGLIEAENPSTVDFVEVRRPRGKPMFLIVRTIDRRAISKLEPLEDDEKQTLRGRLEKHKQRALVEARRREDLTLSQSRNGDRSGWQYKGRWFLLESTAGETLTRRSIVRLEQIFTAYRQLLPPRTSGSAQLTIRVYG